MDNTIQSDRVTQEWRHQLVPRVARVVQYFVHALGLRRWLWDATRHATWHADGYAAGNDGWGHARCGLLSPLHSILHCNRVKSGGAYLPAFNISRACPLAHRASCARLRPRGPSTGNVTVARNSLAPGQCYAQLVRWNLSQYAVGGKGGKGGKMKGGGAMMGGAMMGGAMMHGASLHLHFRRFYDWPPARN